MLINDTYVDLKKIVRNDYKYTFLELGQRIVEKIGAIKDINIYYDAFPPLVDIGELGAALAYEGSSHHDELLRQINYKLSELKLILPEYK